ncbi:lower collar protein [Curtobacterium phage Reje]|uniref:lower collar protein n=1 Tax=Curtobacterium phage Reje TaxID=2851069 RepID=UPI00220297A9|nr:lower collar protein [Curtobacterium phage Reje]QXG07817.1 lower collar protein [Curtobacterium phage Reje]
MATFTIRLKDLISSTKADISTGKGLGLDRYPIFSEARRADLNQKIVDHFWNQEIGYESIESWRLGMHRRLNEQMPYFNQLYLSEVEKFDPFSTMDIETVSKAIQKNNATSDSEAENSGESVAKGITINNDFPQTGLRQNNTANYATSSVESDSESSNTGVATEKRTDESTGETDQENRTKGYSASPALLLMQWREAMLNIDMLVITTLQDQFMSIWDNGDTYTESGFIL